MLACLEMFFLLEFICVSMSDKLPIGHNICSLLFFDYIVALISCIMAKTFTFSSLVIM